MSELQTLPELEKTTTVNFKRLNESRDKNEPVLVDLFEKRMNTALDVYSDFIRFALEAAIL